MSWGKNLKTRVNTLNYFWGKYPNFWTFLPLQATWGKNPLPL